MPLDLDAVGRSSDPTESTWRSFDCLLYAVGVGAGLGDPTKELAFTTENTANTPQQVLPTFAVVAPRGGGGRRPGFGTFNPAMLVHAEQGIELHQPLPVEGHIRTTSTITGIYDKGSGALVTTETTSVDADTGAPMFTNRASMFIRGEGGFGGDRGPSGKATPPDRAPDIQVTYATRPEQALIYRLSGDRNPLHADPEFARRGGFERPILHGLCTYGVTGRALLHEVCGSDPARVKSISGRFSSPVLPGDDLTIAVWHDGEGRAIFRTSVADRVVIDGGVLTYT